MKKLRKIHYIIFVLIIFLIVTSIIFILNFRSNFIKVQDESFTTDENLQIEQEPAEEINQENENTIEEANLAEVSEQVTQENTTTSGENDKQQFHQESKSTQEQTTSTKQSVQNTQSVNTKQTTSTNNNSSTQQSSATTTSTTTTTSQDTVKRISTSELNAEKAKYLNDIKSIAPGLNYVYSKRGNAFWPYRTSQISVAVGGLTFGTVYYYVDTFVEGNQETFKYYIDWAGN